MKKLSLHTGLMLAMLLAFAACSQSGKNAANQFQLVGTIWQDSTTVDSILTLYIDNHSDVQIAEIPVAEGHFSYQGETSDVAELALADQHQHLYHFYAAKGTSITLNLQQNGHLSVEESDSLNLWIDQQVANLQNLDKKQIVPYIDTLFMHHAGELRSGLLLRDQVATIDDSVFVRRCMGRLANEAKPDWLIQSFESILDYRWLSLGKKFHMPHETIYVAPDTLPILMSTNRLEAMLLYFWADFDSLSVDSLQMLKHIARDYGLYQYGKNFLKETSPSRSAKAHHIELFTFCMHASDSAAWKALIQDIPGKHCLLPGGFAHPLAIKCRVNHLPFVLLTNRFGNYISHDQMKQEELYPLLNNTPVNVKPF